MTNYFVTSVADGYFYDFNDNLVGTSKILMDSNIEVSTSNTDVRGGKGNALQFIYWHSGDMNITLTDVQFNLDFLASTVGSTLETGSNIYTEEFVTLTSGGAGTVNGTPLAIQGSTLYGWVTHDGVEEPERVEFTGSNFTSSTGTEDDVVCVRYYALDSAAKKLTVYSNIVPDKLRLVLDAQLASKEDDSAAVVGKVEVIIPNFQLDGSFALNLTADQVANTPISGRALSSTVNEQGCSANDVLAYIIRQVDNANWYDDAIALAFVGGDLALTDPTTSQATVMAIHSDRSTSYPPTADLTFASSETGCATVSSSGLITTVAAGTTVVSATITNKTSVDANINVVVS